MTPIKPRAVGGSAAVVRLSFSNVVDNLWAVGLRRDQWNQQDQGRKDREREGSHLLQAAPRSRWESGENLQQETEGRSLDLEGRSLGLKGTHQGLKGTHRGLKGMHRGLKGMHRGLLQAGLQGKAHWDKAQTEHRVQTETVRLGTGQDLQEAVRGLLQAGSAVGTAPELQGWRGTAPGLLEGTALVPRAQGGTHLAQREGLGTDREPQDQRGTGTAPVPLDLLNTLPGLRAVRGHLGLTRATLGLSEEEGFPQEL